ncbi:MAG: NAD(P)/FAD-dependent oxidoreductase [Ornithinimicrobium sp.]|uniref:flavin-containing monooxygenase n=1 Tax=Ornithinimicrobium sp. TaxID=1977084 RepID=UPI0026E02A44|nr:NAD(P)/FAD-dependent oxidoreductase [Ornithinimicrobium sp.]MDO5740010.1 NAD(P)/FAD-dependent oxidoreductase [Ornithinimicrobium sp.]
MKIAIIGAGFAGLSAVRVLRSFGHDVVAYEKCPDVGGVWSATRRYPGLTTQNTKDTYSLSELPMPKHFPQWPTSAQVQDYMEHYVDRFDLTPYLRLSTEVTRADPRAEGGWSITTRPAEGGEEVTSEVDYLVVANGIFCEPFVPQYDGRAEFEAAGGRVRAPSEVHSAEEAAGQDVVVVGYGKSACDIAAGLSDAAGSTTVVARQLIWKMPRKLGGALNYKYLMLTRLGEGLFEYLRPNKVEKVLHGPLKPVRNSMLGQLAWVATKQDSLKSLGLVPEGGFERIARSTVSLTTDGFFAKVKEGSISVVRDTHITRLGAVDGRPVAELADGTTRPADLVVCATGFRQEVPFLPQDVQQRLTDERGNFVLYRQIQPIGIPDLSFCGYNSSFFSPLSAEAAALWIACHLEGMLSLPEPEEQRRLIEERLRWMEERTEGHHARGTNLIPFSMHNVDEILDEVGVTRSKATTAKEWLMPIDPSSYRGMVEEMLARRPAQTQVAASAEGRS